MATHSSVLGLENPRDGGAWWAAVYGVAQSQTQLKRLSSSSREIGGSDGKVSARNVGDPGLIPGLGRSCGEGNGNLFQCSCLENPKRGSLVDCCLWGYTKLDTTDATWQQRTKY